LLNRTSERRPAEAQNSKQGWYEMNASKIRLLLWSGCLGAVILFAGDILFYGEWGSARSWSHDYFLSMMAHVAPWRHDLGSITGPVGVGFELLGVLGIWFCCRRAAPRLAAAMLACMYTMQLLLVLTHGIGGPMGFAIRFCGGSSDAVVQILKLEHLLVTAMTPVWYVGGAIWIFLTLWKKAGVPRWTILLCPLLITGRLDFALLYVPAPLGLPLYDGWSNIVDAIWFTVLALTYKDQKIESGIAERA